LGPTRFVPDVLPLTLLAVIYENRVEMAGMPIEEILPRLKSGLREKSSLPSPAALPTRPMYHLITHIPH